MGGLCDEGVEFLRLCNKRNPEKAQHLQDVLVTQHARWTARRIRRALFGQSLPRQIEEILQVDSVAKRQPRAFTAIGDARGNMRAFRHAFSTRCSSDDSSGANASPEFSKSLLESASEQLSSQNNSTDDPIFEQDASQSAAD